MLLQATNFAIANDFTPALHTDINEKPANFLETLNSMANAINERIRDGIYYASIYFNEDNNAFSLDYFTSHDEMLAEYTDNGRFSQDLIMASFTMLIDDETYFTLEIVQG